jgi:hypothetical protein
MPSKRVAKCFEEAQPGSYGIAAEQVAAVFQHSSQQTVLPPGLQ